MSNIPQCLYLPCIRFSEFKLMYLFIAFSSVFLDCSIYYYNYNNNKNNNKQVSSGLYLFAGPHISAL